MTYLDRYDATRAQLERILLRKISRAGAGRDEECGEKEASLLVKELLDRLTAAGLVSDERFARHFSDVHKSRGSSQRMIEQKLRRRGVSSEIIESELKRSLEETGTGDREAALIFATRRRFASRYALKDSRERQKALAALARRGFGFEAAVFALNALGAEGNNDEG